MTFSITISFIFLMYFIFWLQIPGMLLTSLLLPRRLKFSTRLLAGFFMGFMYMAALYYLESLIGVNGIIMVAGPVTSLIAIIMYFKAGRPSVFNAAEGFRWTYGVVFAVIFIASILNVQAKYLFAYSGNTTQVYHDFLFHTGNIAALSRSFPAADIRIDGLTFYYHYYLELIFGMCKHIFHMDAFRVYMNGISFVCAYTLTLGLITLAERIRGVKEVLNYRYFFYCGGLLISGIALLPLNVVGGRFPLSWMNNHFFGNVNAMGLAVALTILMVDVLAEVWYDSVNTRTIIALLVLECATTGFKGTTGIMLVGIGWSVFIVESLVVKKFHLQQLLYNLALTTGFVLAYILVTVGLNPSGANNRAMKFTCQGTLENGRVGQIISRLGLDYMAFPWVIIAVIFTVIFIIGPCVIPFTAFTIDKFKTLIKEGVIGDIFDWFSIGLVLMGLIGFCAVSVPGFSQGYFVITTAGLIFYCSIKYMSVHRLGLLYKAMHVWFAIGMLMFLVDLGHFYQANMQQMAIYYTDSTDRPDLVSKDTMEAYFWLRDNTDEDAIIAVDRLSEELDYRSIYFYASAFSERQCYLEGYDYSDITEKQVEAMSSINDKFYSADPLEAEAALGLQHISYLVVTEEGHPDYQPISGKLKPVFTNDEVTIYKYSVK